MSRKVAVLSDDELRAKREARVPRIGRQRLCAKRRGARKDRPQRDWFAARRPDVVKSQMIDAQLMTPPVQQAPQLVLMPGCGSYWTS